MSRRDPSILGQEYEIEIDADGDCSIIARVVKSHINDSYALALSDATTKKDLDFNQMAKFTLGEIPHIYTEQDVYDVVEKLFDDDGVGVTADESISEWDDAVSIDMTNYGHVQQLNETHSEILNGVFVESHARVGETLYLRFGNIIVRCESRWLE